MDQGEAPPPYSAVDPLLAPANSRNSSASAPLSGNDSPSPDAGSSSTSQSAAQSRPAVVPTHFTSAVTYFEERPPAALDESRDLLHHHMTIYPRSSAKDFPRRPRCWNSGVGDVTQQDWDTFLRYLFPPQLGLAAASQHLPRQLRAEIQRDRKDRPQETDEQRQARIAAVVDEWNQCFFEPRAARIDFVYVGESDAAPSSALCPRCYPAATRATQSPGAAGAPDGQHSTNPNVPSPVPGQHTPSPTAWNFPPNHPYPYYPMQGHYGPYGLMPSFPGHGLPPNNQPPQYYPPPPPPPPGVAPWQWSHWAYTQPQFGNTGTQKTGGPLGWISSLTSQAQKYGERFAEQAQHYGDQISTQAMHYGRQVEEQALAHGRWLEEQARLHGRKQGVQPSAPYTYQQPPQSPGHTTSPTQNTPTPPSNPSPADPPLENHSPALAPSQTTLATNSNHNRDLSNSETKADNKDPINDRSRRESISSISSESSLSSIDSISTTSDLGPSDLATVRTQLQELHDRHDRTLYEAAVDLRRQLDVLQESRREARASGRQNWRNGWGRQQPNSADGTDWGRWESPEQQERQSTERRAMKEEMRATKKAFRDIVRRARDEQRDRRRAKRNRRRQALASVENNAKDKNSLANRMGNLALADTPNQHPVRAQTEPASFETSRRGLPPRPNPSSDISAQDTVNTPSSASASQSSVNEFPTELPGRKARTQDRFKEMLKPRIAKKQHKHSDSKDGKGSKKDPSG
ncbi:hypothetical protein F1880_002162 [Penicillium rolfsii]|nr:hypothetical protein F1880_002162 [Penicillium rolfsii]